MARTTIHSGQLALDLALPGAPTVSTPTANDNSTKIASTAYIDSKYSNEIYVLRDLGATVIAEVVGTSRVNVTTATGLTDGQAWVGPIVLPTATITGFSFYVSVTGNFTGDNENSLALYTRSGATLTRVAITANDANIWKQTSPSIRSAAFTAPYAATRGVYYAALLYNNSAQTTQPAIGSIALGSANINFGDITTNVKMYGTVNATALGSTIAMSTLAGSAVKYYLAAY